MSALSYVKYMATRLSILAGLEEACPPATVLNRLWDVSVASLGFLCCSCQITHRPTHPRWPLRFPLREIDGVFKCFLSSQMAPGRWLHAITIIYPDAGCQGVSSAGLFPVLRSFRDLMDRCSTPQTLCEALQRFESLLSLVKVSFDVSCCLPPAKLSSLPPLWWQLRGEEWHSSFSLFACPSPPVSLCQSFQGPPVQICQADGGPAFYMSLERSPGNTICGPQRNVFEPCETRMVNQCSAMHGPDSLKNPTVSCLPSAVLL